MRRLDGPLIGAVVIFVLFMLAAAVEFFGLAKRFFRRLGRLLRPKGASSREEQDGWTFV